MPTVTAQETTTSWGLVSAIEVTEGAPGDDSSGALVVEGAAGFDGRKKDF